MESRQAPERDLRSRSHGTGDGLFGYPDSGDVECMAIRRENRAGNDWRGRKRVAPLPSCNDQVRCANLTRYPPSMSRQLLFAAREKAERSEPAVRAAALMHIARVLARSDQIGAEQLLEQGISLAKRLESQISSQLLDNAVYLAAATSPKHAFPLYPDHRRTDPFGGAVVGLINAMAQHGHVDDAIEYLSDPLPGDGFPLHFVNNLAGECRDDETRLKLLRLAMRAWKERGIAGSIPEERFAEPAFIAFFGRHWSLLPQTEARPVLNEILQWALEKKTEPISFPLTLTENPVDPHLTSETELRLFQLMPALRSLEPDFAQRVLTDRPQLAVAVKRFPMGMQSVHEASRKFDPARDDAMMIGDSEVIPMTEALATNFEAAFREAHDRYARDIDPENPNEAPKECWPSAWEYRNILFKAGQHQGLQAEKHLTRIPDPDLRLFAQIELCAAVEGLPQIGGTITFHSSRQSGKQCSPAEMEEIFGPIVPGIRCPKCEWAPRANCRWSCKCGHLWNTFDTRGLCPECGHQWEITGCLQCGEMSPHTNWYVRQ